MSPLGTISRTAEGGYVLYYERDFAHPAAKVWAAITDTAVAANWIGDIEAELRVGGKFIIRFRNSTNVMTGKITALEPERLIEYDWEENYGMAPSLVRWTITAKGPAACRLTLMHVLPPGAKPDEIISFGAGWHAFLDGAAVAMEGGDGIKTAYDAEAWPGLEKAYTERCERAPVLAIDGVLSPAPDGGTLLRFERLIDRPVAKVWSALTEPKVLANWLGDVEIEPRAGGKFVLTFRESGYVMTGAITAFEPQRVLEFTWFEPVEAPQMPPSLARWELSPAQGGCRLVMTHRFPKGMARKDILPFLGGWEAFLDVLAQGADGIFIPYVPDGPYAAQYRAKYP